MLTDLQCECCGRWVAEQEDSFVLQGRSVCRGCQQHPVLAWFTRMFRSTPARRFTFVG